MSNNQNQKINIAIVGATGRMGKMLLEAIANQSTDFNLVVAVDIPKNPHIGEKIPGTDIVISDNLETAFQNNKVHCLIDFTRPQGTLQNLQICQKYGVAMVIGTTGFDDSGKAAIAETAKKIPIVFAPNMAVGVNLAFKLLDTAAKILNSGYDVEIVEAHHRLKVDSPSGTALRMGEVVANALNRSLKDCAIYGREGVLGERKDETIAFSTIRGGDIVGDHTVMFCGIGERVEITHKASSRMPYANGALKAAKFLQSKQNGLFDMQNVLGLQ